MGLMCEEYQEPEDDGSLHYWMWCEEQDEEDDDEENSD
jgi:hypothetical protein